MKNYGHQMKFRNASSKQRTFLQVETNSLCLKEEFGDMSFWPYESGRFNVLHLTDGHSLQVVEEDLQTSSNVPQIAEQHSGELSQVFTYGGTPALQGQHYLVDINGKVVPL